MLEFERYELSTGPAYRFDLERRDLFKLLGGGLLFVLFFDGQAIAQESGRTQGFRADARPVDQRRPQNDAFRQDAPQVLLCIPFRTRIVVLRVRRVVDGE